MQSLLRSLIEAQALEQQGIRVKDELQEVHEPRNGEEVQRFAERHERVQDSATLTIRGLGKVLHGLLTMLLVKHLIIALPKGQFDLALEGIHQMVRRCSLEDLIDEVRHNARFGGIEATSGDFLAPIRPVDP